MEKEVNVGKIAIWLVVILLAVFLIVKFSDVSGSAVQKVVSPTVCADYSKDNTCDDTPQDCGVYYQEGVSYDGCNECQTGGFDCKKLIEEPNIVEEPKCTDSDNGINYKIKGITRGSPSYGVGEEIGKTYVEVEDYCILNRNAVKSSLVEFYCKDGKVTAMPTYECPNDCRNGACVGGTIPEEPTMTPKEPKYSYVTREDIIKMYSIATRIEYDPLNEIDLTSKKCGEVCKREGYNICLSGSVLIEGISRDPDELVVVPISCDENLDKIGINLREFDEVELWCSCTNI